MAARELDFPAVARPLAQRSGNDEKLLKVRALFPAAPPGELLAIWWLMNVAKYQLYRDFYPQADALGGRAGRGFVLDILVVRDQPRPLDIEVQSEAFHDSFVHGEPVAIKVYDKVRRQVLEQNGYAVVWVSDVKLDQALDDTMRRALAGQDVM